MQLSDETLAQQVRGGDHSALTQLVERHAKKYYSLAYRFLKNRNDAEDIVQTAFLKFWRDPQKWNPEKQTKFSTWFYRVVTNLCLDQIKKRKPQLMAVETYSSQNAESPESLNVMNERQKMLESLLEQLPERQKIALNLCFYEGLSNQEAAEVMGIGMKALQSLLMRGKKTMREKVQLLEKRRA